MTFPHSSQFISIFTFLYLSTALPLTSLLSLNCTPPKTNQTFVYNKAIKSLINNLTSAVTKTRFTTSTTSFEHHHQFTGLLQCRLGLNSTTCIHCAQTAKHTISTLCPNSDAITAWFDGCYIQYHSSHVSYGEIKYFSCSVTASAVDGIHFEDALETLLLRLRAEVNLASRHGFSYGDLVYGNNTKVYALVECVRSLSPHECEVCVGEAIDKLHEFCGGKEGGTVVSGLCLVRFEKHQFYSKAGDSVADSDSFCVSESGDSGGINIVKVVWVWGGGVAFVVGVVFFAWLLRRSAINRARVE